MVLKGLICYGYGWVWQGLWYCYCWVPYDKVYDVAMVGYVFGKSYGDYVSYVVPSIHGQLLWQA